ncbi:MAG: glycosyltransferase family 39 protein, partial [Candidatus Fermentibacteraceae bacterium]
MNNPGLSPGEPPLIFSAMQRETLRIAALLTVLSLFTHLFLLNRKSYWVDEAYAAGLMHRPLSEVMELSSRSTPHPPGAFLLMRASAATAGNSPAGVRFFNALAVASGVVPMFLLSRRILKDTKNSFLAAMTWVLSPFSVSLGQEAWVYGLPAALSLWFLLFSAVPWKGRIWLPVTWFLTGLAGLYTQFSFL